MTTLYSSANCPDCHRVRFVLSIKGINVEILEMETTLSAEADLAELNPYHETPTLVDRELVLYGPGIITEYLDERYPHPPLMPVDPVSRARLRLVRYRVMRDWYPLMRQIMSAKGDKAAKLRKQLQESLTAANELFSLARFLLNEDITLVDCALAPLLWRLPVLDVTLGKEASAITAYMERLFSLDSFQDSLSESENEAVSAEY